MSLMRKTTLCALAAFVLAAGCSRHDPATDPSIVRFTSSARGYEVRSTDVTLSDGDVVGIFAGSPISAGNVRGVVSGKSIFPDRDMYWEEGQSVPTRFSAYCPYSREIPGETFPFSVSADQRTFAGYAASDLRTSSITVAPGNVVDFIFEHRLTKVIIDVDPGSRTVSGLSLWNVFRGCTVDMETGALSALADRGEIRAGLAAVSAEKSAYVAVFVPAALQPDVVFTADGKAYRFTLTEPLEFLPGCAYRASLRLDDALPETAVGFSLTITDWESGEPLEFAREQ